MFGKIVDFSLTGNRLAIQFENKKGMIEAVSETMFHVLTTEEPQTFAGQVPVEAERKNGFIQISTGRASARVYDGFRIDFLKSDGTFLSKDYTGKRTNTDTLSQNDIDLMSQEGHQINIKKREHEIQVVKELEDNECIYGLGDRTGFLNKRGYAYELWNTDNPEPQVDSFEKLYKAIPFIISLKKDSVYGIYFNNSYRSFWDFGKENSDYYFFAADEGELDYYFFTGETINDLIEQYTGLTGRTPLPQMWALGYQQSRWGYETEEDVRNIAKRMRSNHIPCDAIHLDIDYMDHYKVFTWNKEKFNAKKCVSDLAEEGFKIVTIIDPGVKAEAGYPVYDEGISKHYFVTDAQNNVYVNQVWPGDAVYPDFGRREVRDWWGNQIGFLLEQGVRGIWNDMNEPASFRGEIPPDIIFYKEDKKSTHAKMHNLYGHYMAQATYQGLKKLDKRRPFVITRACFSGSQQYTTGWTGDNHSIWSHLQMAIPQLCNLGLSGMGFVGTDVGGFGSDTTAELLIRWMQVGCFSPLFRNHSTRGSKNQEPWAFDAQTLNICRKYIELRYQLLPYLYDQFRVMEQKGTPVMRPLIYQYMHDENVRELNDEFMVGEDILAAPVVTQGSRKRMVYLPEGKWFDFHTGEEIEGAKYLLKDAPLEICPIYIKAGAIIPKYPIQEYVGQLEIKELTLDIFPGEGEYLHYQDDQETFAYQNGSYNLYRITVDKERCLKISLLHNGYEKVYRSFSVVYAGKKTIIPFCGDEIGFQLEGEG